MLCNLNKFMRIFLLFFMLRIIIIYIYKIKYEPMNLKQVKFNLLLLIIKLKSWASLKKNEWPKGRLSYIYKSADSFL